jgi:uncharacterized OB-fold protein
MSTASTVPFHVLRDVATAEFFDAARQGRLLIRECPACGRLFPPYQSRCSDSDDLVWRESSGNGCLVTWTVDHGLPLSPDLAGAGGSAPILGIVELDEGPWMASALPGASSAELSEGRRMRVRFLQLGGGEPVPVFAAADPDSLCDPRPTEED